MLRKPQIQNLIHTTINGVKCRIRTRSVTVNANAVHKASLETPNIFWGNAAKDIDWIVPPKTILDLDAAPHGRWFADGVLNVSYNCIDRHIEAGHGSRNAIIYDSPVTDTIRVLSFNHLHEDVVKLASLLRSMGVSKGDRAVIYMPNMAEAAVAMLACARIGAVHSVVFGGFSAAELATRLKDCKPKVVLAASCGIEVTKVIDYKVLLDAALDLAALEVPELKKTKCVVLQREARRAELQAGRDVDWQQAVHDPALKVDESCEAMGGSDPLYILYTSGTTGQPKGVLRDSGGYSVALRWTMDHVYDCKAGDVFWAASDVGWVVGHSYSVYGPLLMGCTSVLYEGKPVGTPDAANFWRVVERHKVNLLMTAPTALRTIKRVDEEGEMPSKFDLRASLRSLFLVGERSDPDSLRWAEHALQVPIRDHWWQTETGWPICSNLLGVEGVVKAKYGSTYGPCPGYDVQILDDSHRQVPPNTLGNIAIKLPLPPGVLLSLYNSPQRFHSAYFEAIPGYYDTGDAGYVDEEGYVYVMSRTDDVINVAGHRLSSGAMEEVIADHHDVAEVAVIGMRHTLKGHIPFGLVVLNSHCSRPAAEVLKECKQMVRERIGPVASFKDAVVVQRLPKTRSGKVLRGTMRAIGNGEDYKVPATIEDPQVLADVAVIIDEAHRHMHYELEEKG